MRAILSALVLLHPALHAEEAPAAPRRQIPAVSLLPSGSKLHGVMLPRYDDKQRLSAVLKADVMTLVTDQQIGGDQVTLAFYHTDQSPRARVEMKNALLDQATGLLEAGGGVTLRGDRIEADGSGLIYHMEKAKGFLTGPAETRIRAHNETTMNHQNRLIRPAAALAGAALLTAASAEPPAALNEAEKSAIAADSASAAPAHAKATGASHTSLRAELAAAAAATQAAATFLAEAGIAGNGSDLPITPPAEPLKLDPGPQDTVVNCDGGMYFDADAGLFVYLKNVRVNDPRFELSGANELKIFLAKKPAPSGEQKQDGTSAFGSGFGDVERVVATGAVRILQKQPQPGKEPVEASGAIFTYHPKTGEIVLTGGYPWVKQGANFMRAREPQLSLRIHKNGSFVTEGNWDMGGRLNQNP